MASLAREGLSCVSCHKQPKEKATVYGRTIRTFGSQSRKRERGGEVPGDGTSAGQSRTDNTDMVCATIGADDVWRIRRLYERNWAASASERSDSQSADGPGVRTVLEAAGDRTD